MSTNNSPESFVQPDAGMASAFPSQGQPSADVDITAQLHDMVNQLFQGEVTNTTPPAPATASGKNAVPENPNTSQMPVSDGKSQLPKDAFEVIPEIPQNFSGIESGKSGSVNIQEADTALNMPASTVSDKELKVNDMSSIDSNGLQSLSGLSVGQQMHIPMDGDGIVTSDAPPFKVPKEVDTLPEPREIHKTVGSPSLPEGIEHDNEATKPYWLAVSGAGKDMEAQIQPTGFFPVDDIAPFTEPLQPTQLVENLPPPPKRPPPQPPSKSWMVEKLTKMTGQKFEDPSEKEKPKTPEPAVEQGPYWLRTHTPNAGGGTITLVPDQSPKNKSVSNLHFDVDAVRQDFPILRQKVNGKPLVWLDNAATTQKPQAMIDRMAKFYEEENSNVHRGAHELAARATDAFELAREKVSKFLKADNAKEIVFTRGTTECMNLLAQAWGGRFLEKGDEIILTEVEHHSNIVPWQHIAQKTGAKIKVAPIHDSGEIDLAAYEALFTRKTRIVSMTHVSNALGTVMPVKEMVETAHRYDCIAIVDGAQSVPHFPVNVKAIDADFYVLSGHKLFGPTGIGVLYGKTDLLNVMPPWQGGGNMIESVSFKETKYNPPPSKFEAGTGILAGAVGLGASIDYLEKIGFESAARYEEELLEYAQKKLSAIKGVKMIGTAAHKAGVLSFVTDKLSPDEMGHYLNAEGIAVRTGHHCAQPALAHYGLKATIRPSIAFYNTYSEIDLLVRTVKKALEAN